jgi:hypothetical protein
MLGSITMRFAGACALGAMILTGCVSSQETYNADGSKGHVISCTPAWTGGIVGSIANAQTSWGTCFQKAGEICGARGYAVLARSDEPTFSAMASQYGASAATSNNRMMIVRCGEAGTTAQKPA